MSSDEKVAAKTAPNQGSSFRSRDACDDYDRQLFQTVKPWTDVPTDPPSERPFKRETDVAHRSTFVCSVTALADLAAAAAAATYRGAGRSCWHPHLLPTFSIAASSYGITAKQQRHQPQVKSYSFELESPIIRLRSRLGRLHRLVSCTFSVFTVSA